MTEPKAKGPPQSGPHFQAVPDPLTDVPPLEQLFYDLWTMAQKEASTGKRFDASLSLGRYQREVVSRVEQLEAQVGRLRAVAVRAVGLVKYGGLDDTDSPLAVAVRALQQGDIP